MIVRPPALNSQINCQIYSREKLINIVNPEVLDGISKVNNIKLNNASGLSINNFSSINNISNFSRGEI